MKNVTYLLGAGASANALPLNKELAPRMSVLAKEITRHLNPFTEVITPGIQPHFYSRQALGEYLTFFSQEAIRNGTIDTYANHLYKKGQNADMLKLKLSLSIFFACEQQKNEIDSRYLPFLAKTLSSQNSPPRLKTNISILNWNYDIQSPLAYSKYYQTSLITAFERLGIYPYTKLPAAFINLNGIAGFYTTPESAKFEHMFYENNTKKIADFWSTAMLSVESAKDGKISFSDTFSFAWEIDEKHDRLKKALRIAEKTETLVIIGYSFPDYNHALDRLLIETMRKKYLEEVFIQDNNCDIKKILDRFDFLDGLKITPLSKTEEFYVPTSIL